MTDKQIIIIDGLACVNCPEAKRCQEQQAKKEYAINQVLQDIPSEYANVIARLKQIIPSVTRCDYVFEKLLQRKEQENKDLREDIKDIANLLDLDTDEEYNFGNIEIAIKDLKQECERLKHDNGYEVGALERTIDNLKAENKHLNELLNQALKDYDRTLQTLADIKEIAENSCCFQATSDCEEFKNCAECGKNSDAESLRLVLEKINEVQGDN